MSPLRARFNERHTPVGPFGDIGMQSLPHGRGSVSEWKMNLTGASIPCNL